MSITYKLQKIDHPTGTTALEANEQFPIMEVVTKVVSLKQVKIVVQAKMCPSCRDSIVELIVVSKSSHIVSQETVWYSQLWTGEEVALAFQLKEIE